MNIHFSEKVLSLKCTGPIELTFSTVFNTDKRGAVVEW